MITTATMISSIVNNIKIIAVVDKPDEGVGVGVGVGVGGGVNPAKKKFSPSVCSWSPIVGSPY